MTRLFVWLSLLTAVAAAGLAITWYRTEAVALWAELPAALPKLVDLPKLEDLLPKQVLTALGRTPPPAGGPAAATTSAAPAGRPPTAVEAVAAALGVITESVEAIGTLRSAESVLIKSEVAGRVHTIGFTEGTAIRTGEVLIQLDDSIPRAQLEQAKASLIFSRSNFQRFEELARSNAASAKTRDEALAKLRIDEAAVQLAAAVLAKMQILAPQNGNLGLRQVSVGDYLAPGDPIVNLEQIDPIKVDFRVPEVFAPAVRTGQTVAITVDALPERAFQGQVLAIDPKIDENGRNLLVRAVVPNAERALLPGMFARVLLTLERRDQAVTIPEESIVPGRPPAVFRVIDGKAVRTPVVTGQRRKGQVEIRQGVAAGEMVVTAGQLKIGDGAPVRVVGANGRSGS